MSPEVVSAVLAAILVISLLLGIFAFATRSWLTMWAAAVLSLLFSLAAGFGIGPYVFLLTCLQLGSAVALRGPASVLGSSLLLLLACLVWIVIVPVQLVVGSWLPWLLAFPLVTLLASFALVAREHRINGA